MKYFIIILLLVFSGLSVLADEEKAVPPPDFANGAKVWAKTCARCHNMRPASDYRDDLWRPVIYHMRVRANLTGQETRDILKFLQESN